MKDESGIKTGKQNQGSANTPQQNRLDHKNEEVFFI